LTFSGSVGSVARCRCVVRPIRKKKITSGYAPASGAGE